MPDSSGLGLVIDDRHEERVNSFLDVPLAFCAGISELPDEHIPPLVIEDQASTNSCAGHALAAACSQANYNDTGEVVRFSRWFAYLTAAYVGGFSGRDQGTSIASTIEAATKYGVCLESTFPFPGRYTTSHWSSESQSEAYKHRHFGDTQYDCRDWSIMMAAVTDRRAIVIGTTWYGGQDSMGWIEDERAAFSGSFRGYHAREICGWTTVNGVMVPVIQNSHGMRHGKNGRTAVMPGVWERWKRDPNFCAFMYNDIDEVEPKRRSWKLSSSGDEC